MKYIVCYSGGHSSALVAVEAVRRYGKENVILLNHDISSEVEHEDIKRFKQEVADYLGIDITYANADNYEHLTPLRVATEVKHAFQSSSRQAFCTYWLKTRPFHKWLEDNCSNDKENYIILYGFDENEDNRISRRKVIMRSMGFKTDYPLAYWPRTIQNIEEIGINRPITYETFKHANCQGCLKSGKQHWYIVYCTRPDIFKEAIEAEKMIGHSIIKGVYLKELVCQFRQMKRLGIVPTDRTNAAKFWAEVRKRLKEDSDNLPCDCMF